MSKASEAQWWQHPATPAVFICLLALAIYLPSLRGGFIFDDDSAVTRNSAIQSPGWLARVWDPSARATPDYFPVVYTALAVQWRMFHDDPVGYHLVNVLLHVGAAILLWRLLRRIGMPGAYLAALVFAVHPVNVASAGWIAEQKNTIATVLVLLSLLAWVRCDEGEGREKWGWYGAALGLFVLSLLAKTSVVMAPAVLLLYAWWRRGRIGLWDVLRSVPFFAVSALLGWITLRYQQEYQETALVNEVVRDEGFLPRLLGAGQAAWFYLSKVMLPRDLLFMYPKWQMDPSRLSSYLPLAGLLGLLGVLWVYRKTWGRPVLFALGSYLLLMLPVLGFVNASWMRFSYLADHWQYPAILLPIALLTGGAAYLFSDQSPLLKMCLAAVWVAALGVLSYRQAKVYGDEEALWATTKAGNPEVAWVADNRLGLMWANKGLHDLAADYYRRAIASRPTIADAHVNLGAALTSKANITPDELEEAMAHYREAIDLNPNLAEAHSGLARGLLVKGEFQRATQEFSRAIKLKPQNASAYEGLGWAWYGMGNKDNAARSYRIALEIDPRYAPAHYRLADLLAEQGNFSEAIEHFQAVVRLWPNRQDAQIKLQAAREARRLQRDRGVEVSPASQPSAGVR